MILFDPVVQVATVAHLASDDPPDGLAIGGVRIGCDAQRVPVRDLQKATQERRAPGLRVSVPVYMARPSIRTQEDLVGKISGEVLERNSPRFAILTQQGISYGYDSQDDSIARAERAGKYLAANNKATPRRPPVARGLYS